MERNYKARGIVLHSLKYGESSLIAYLLTDVGGRETFLIQGVRSSRGRGNKGALFQPLFLLEFEGIRLPNAQMHRMKEVRNLLPLRNIPFDVRKSTIALFMAEVLYRLIREVEANEPLFDFICDSIQALDRLEEGISNFHLWFLVHLSTYLGFYPGNEYLEGGCFDIKNGLFCSEMPPHLMGMNPDSTRLLGQLMELEVGGLGALALIHNERRDFLEALLSFFGYHLEAIHSVQSLQILREVFGAD